MKVLALVILFAVLVSLAACESTAKSPAPANGAELGNSGIHASGYLETGGTVRAR